jgi:hypothetical protein
MITIIATPSKCIALTPMEVGHQRIARRTLDHLHKKEASEHSTRDQISSVNKVAHQAEVAVTVEAHSHTSLCIACIMAMIATTA